MRGRQHNGSPRKGWVFVCWSLFAAGLVVQLLAPHLKVSNRAFVIPREALSVEGRTISPAEIIRRQRIMQVVSAVLTASGALGLAFHYRDILFRRASREATDPPDYRGDRCSDGQRQRTSTIEESPKKR